MASKPVPTPVPYPYAQRVVPKIGPPKEFTPPANQNARKVRLSNQNKAQPQGKTTPEVKKTKPSLQVIKGTEAKPTPQKPPSTFNQKVADKLKQGTEKRDVSSTTTTTASPQLASKNALDASGFSATSKIAPLDRKGRVMFDGVEFRAVRDLGHINSETLWDIYRTGRAPKDALGNPLREHHHLQKYHRENGAFIVEMPAKNHKVNNPLQHPKGNKKGQGLTLEQRADYDKLRSAFHKERARQELIKRGLLNEKSQ